MTAAYAPVSRRATAAVLGRGRVVVFAVLAMLGLQAVLVATDVSRVVPKGWNVGLAAPIDRAEGWVQDNRSSHWLFRGFLDPLSDFVRAAIDGVSDGLLWLPWFVVPALAFVLAFRRRNPSLAIVSALALTYPAVVGVWESAMQTLALMIVSVAASVAIGVPLGVLSALRPTVERIVRPTLDAMQTIPATVYLIPVVLLFGIGAVPAAIATVIYALPPVVRLTALGIRGVPAATVEAGVMFGSTPRQLLRKVQLPQAVPSIVTGVNQTINMALGLVVIASLVGAGGLGQEVLSTLQLRSPGRGLVVGGAIVAIAIALDRISRAFIERDPADGPLRRWLLLGGTIVVVLVIVGRVAGWRNVPFDWDASIADPIDRAVIWIRDHISDFTRWLNDFTVRDVLLRARRWMTERVAWPVLITAAALLCWLVRGWKLALFAVVGLLAIALVGMWTLAIDTLIQSVVAVVLASLIAVPIGVWAGRSPRVDRVLSPVLDALQTIPSLVYTIPFVMLFTVSAVPGIIASVLYAIPAGIRLTALGIREVESAPIEAATSFGATPRQVLLGVRVPLAAPAIVLALNQVIMMVLAMVIIAGMVGGGALGFEAVKALTRSETGLGFEVGIAIVVMAIILDRLTQGLAEKLAPPRGH